MSRPTSFRLPEALLTRLEEEASRSGTTVTALVTSLLDEGLKMRRFPGIFYRECIDGRHATISGGPEVWEIVRDVKELDGSIEERIGTLAEEVSFGRWCLDLALDFYAAFPDEIDRLIAENDRIGQELCELAKRRERLLVR